MEPTLYIGREQTLVKHLILKKYLEKFAHILGSHWSTLTYVDCFSGPWNVRSDELSDSSFSIALNELRKARETHSARHRNISLRCLFLEKDPTAFLRLQKFADDITDAEVLPLNLELEEAVNDIVSFVKKGGDNSFPFIFIDPTGWTGFAMDVIEPLLQLKRVEVLINFMTADIRRFVTSQPQTEKSFLRLFGSTDFKRVVEGLSGNDREDALVKEYRKVIASRGNFAFTCSAIVLHPECDRTRYHLIYATRHHRGVEVFKNAEKAAMLQMEEARINIRQRKHEELDGPSLFPDLQRPSDYFDFLRQRYTGEAKEAVCQLIRNNQRVAYDDAWELALSYPLTWESDLKAWLREWTMNKSDGCLEILGMASRQVVPRYGQGNVLVWRTAPDG
jgi:three-Cys-motif partner protein